MTCLATAVAMDLGPHAATALWVEARFDRAIAAVAARVHGSRSAMVVAQVQNLSHFPSSLVRILEAGVMAVRREVLAWNIETDQHRSSLKRSAKEARIQCLEDLEEMEHAIRKAQR